MKNAFRWAEFLYTNNPTYSSAVQRIARYMITELDLAGQHNTIITRYTLFFEEMQIRRILASVGISSLVYGNTFISVALPFDRHLRCPLCGLERPAKAVEYSFENFKYVVKCACGYYGEHKRVDKYSDDVNRTRVILWDPKLIELNTNLVGDSEYYMHVEPLLRHRVQKNNKFVLDTTPWEFIEAIRDDRLFKFSPGQLLHISNETLPGFNIEWGLPPSIALFRLHYQSAVLRRANEAIALDFITPFRIIFPQAASGAADPVQVMGLQTFVGKMQNMVKERRKDPTAVQVSPVPVGYQAIGGEGKALNVYPELKANNEELLNGAGFPADLFYGTLNVQALPAALRLFENTWDHLYYGYNKIIQFIANKVSRYFSWPPITAKLQRITLADDIERRQVLMQLAAAGQASQGTFFKAYGLNFMEEFTDMVREQLEMQEKQKQIAEEFKMQQQMEQEGPGVTPGDATVQAQQLAMQVVGDPMNSRQLLHQLAQSDEQLYALVKMYVERIRSQMSSEAGRQALQQGLMAAGPGGVTGAGSMPMGGA
jgi:hypothetical protein